MPATTPTPVLTPAPTPTPAPMPAPAPVAAEEAAIERSTSPQTPIRALHFDYRGYSGGIHYSPEGYIVPSTHSQPNVLFSDSDDEEGELQYLDVCTPVLLFAWYNSDEPPIQTMVYPRLDQPGTLCIGEVILQDFREGLHALGLPVGSQIQRFLDVMDYWSSIDVWTNPIPVFGRNKVIYIKTVGIDITPPDHFFELLR
ncbi:hypothetical protein B0H10DRAFT_2239629 [Mycena sp. CBHHK59/15]|nr:hypothetical protein B0H10DRAFT_2239629 [Mycena sp. CBHHK59/15]